MLLDDRQLQLGHLLHLSVHVDLVQQRAGLAAEETQGVLPPLTLGQQRGAGRVESCHPVLQVCLVGGLEEKKLIRLGLKTGLQVTAGRCSCVQILDVDH